MERSNSGAEREDQVIMKSCCNTPKLYNVGPQWAHYLLLTLFILPSVHASTIPVADPIEESKRLSALLQELKKADAFVAMFTQISAQAYRESLAKDAKQFKEDLMQTFVDRFWEEDPKEKKRRYNDEVAEKARTLQRHLFKAFLVLYLDPIRAIYLKDQQDSKESPNELIDRLYHYALINLKKDVDNTVQDLITHAGMTHSVLLPLPNGGDAPQANADPMPLALLHNQLMTLAQAAAPQEALMIEDELKRLEDEKKQLEEKTRKNNARIAELKRQQAQAPGAANIQQPPAQELSALARALQQKRAALKKVQERPKSPTIPKEKSMLNTLREEMAKRREDVAGRESKDADSDEEWGD